MTTSTTCALFYSCFLSFPCSSHAVSMRFAADGKTRFITVLTMARCCLATCFTDTGFLGTLSGRFFSLPQPRFILPSMSRYRMDWQNAYKESGIPSGMGNHQGHRDCMVGKQLGFHRCRCLSERCEEQGHRDPLGGCRFMARKPFIRR
jgi:hypothetical protein